MLRFSIGCVLIGGQYRSNSSYRSYLRLMECFVPLTVNSCVIRGLFLSARHTIHEFTRINTNCGDQPQMPPTWIHRWVTSEVPFMGLSAVLLVFTSLRLRRRCTRKASEQRAADQIPLDLTGLHILLMFARVQSGKRASEDRVASRWKVHWVPE